MGGIIFDDCQFEDDHTECTHVGGGRHDEFWAAHNARCAAKKRREEFMARWWPVFLAIWLALVGGLVCCLRYLS